MYDLDFSQLPEIQRHRIFKGLPDWIREPLSSRELPESLDRLHAASFFLGEVTTDKEGWYNRAYIRAALSEFRSVHQALRWDLSGTDTLLHPPGKSTNPLVHLVYRLRRLAVYVANTQTARHEVEATFRIMDYERTTKVEILLIEDIEDYLRRENLEHYRDEDISRICAWFEANQRIYGAPQVLDIGIAQYALELCDVYKHRSTDA